MEQPSRLSYQDLHELYSRNELTLTDFAPSLLGQYASVFDQQFGNGSTPFSDNLQNYYREGKEFFALSRGQGVLENPNDIFREPVMDMRILTVDRYNTNPAYVYNGPDSSVDCVYGRYPRSFVIEAFYAKSKDKMSEHGRVTNYYHQLRQLSLSNALAGSIVLELASARNRRKTVSIMHQKINNCTSYVAEDPSDLLVQQTRLSDMLYTKLGAGYLSNELTSAVISNLCSDSPEAAYAIFKAVVHMDTSRRGRENLEANNTLRGPILHAIDQGNISYAIDAYEDALRRDTNAFRVSHKYCREFPGLMHLYKKASADKL